MADYLLTQTGSQVQSILDNSMPKSGGNFTGAVTINNQAVMTKQVTGQTPTATASVSTYGSRTRAYKIGNIAFFHMASKLVANIPTSTNIYTGLPVPSKEIPVAVAGVDGKAYTAIISTSGEFKTDVAFATSEQWYFCSVAYECT